MKCEARVLTSVAACSLLLGGSPLLAQPPAGGPGASSNTFVTAAELDFSPPTGPVIAIHGQNFGAAPEVFLGAQTGILIPLQIVPPSTNTYILAQLPVDALFSNTIGDNNIAIGAGALLHNASGAGNIGSGARTLGDNNNTAGVNNIAVGFEAGRLLQTGSDNIYIGHPGAGSESNTIRVGAGSHTRAFLAGTYGVTTGLGDAVAVYIDSGGQLGTIVSSGHFKEDVRDMGDASAALMRLRPVTFRYKQAFTDGTKPLTYGLIAEEVAEVLPNLVVYDRAGRPETVQYHLLNVMLLNELQRHHRLLQSQAEQLEAQSRTIELLLERLEAMETK